MRRSKELMVLLALFVVMATGVLWYVINRRAQNRARPPATTTTLAPELPAKGPLPSTTPAVVPEPVVLGGPNERKTIDFSTGQAVVKDSPEDKAAIDAAMRDIAEATKGVTFEAQKPAETPKK